MGCCCGYLLFLQITATTRATANSNTAMITARGVATTTSIIDELLPVCCWRVGVVHVSGAGGGEEATMTVEVMGQSCCTVVAGQVTVCEQLSVGIGR